MALNTIGHRGTHKRDRERPFKPRPRGRGVCPHLPELGAGITSREVLLTRNINRFEKGLKKFLGDRSLAGNSSLITVEDNDNNN